MGVRYDEEQQQEQQQQQILSPLPRCTNDNMERVDCSNSDGQVGHCLWWVSVCVVTVVTYVVPEQRWGVADGFDLG